MLNLWSTRFSLDLYLNLAHTQIFKNVNKLQIMHEFKPHLYPSKQLESINCLC